MKNIGTNNIEIKSFPLAIIVSRFNQSITDRLLEGALERLQELGFTDDLISIVTVPGAVEIPLTAKRLAEKGKFQAIITLGAVIRGQTSHYDYVCQIVAQGCLRVSLDNNIPVIFGVLTTENQQQALQRAGGNHSHKGLEAVDAAIEMVNILTNINE
jgi:6,7-dimethyl-8-ribityllumazine synthase